MELPEEVTHRIGLRVFGFIVGMILLIIAGYLIGSWGVSLWSRNWTQFKHRIAMEELTTRVTSQDFAITGKKEGKLGKDMTRDELTEALYNCVRDSEELSGRVAEIEDIASGNIPVSVSSQR